MKDVMRWGIMGPGNISHKFAEGLEFLDEAEITAVASHSMERAQNFAREFNIKRAYGSYEEFLKDPDIDIVYIGTTNQLHKECTLMCLKAGKAVVCEKPFTVNSKQAEEVIDYARSNNIFLMEAMWTRYLPAIVKIRELLNKGVIGEVKKVKADFSFKSGNYGKGRLFDLNLGGGALLDVGIYTLSFANMILGGKPSEVVSMPCIGSTGVDEQFSAILKYDDDKMACVSGGIVVESSHDAYIFGGKGFIYVPDFWHAKSFTLHLDGKEEQRYDIPYESVGYNYEALEAMKCIREGKTESEIMPLDETLEIIKIMDSMRNEWKLKYPFES